jgi:hypothetical protein
MIAPDDRPRGDAMAVVVVVETPGGSAEFYDQVMPKVVPGDQLPAGMQSHIAGPIEDGWRVITVWDTADAFHKFRDEQLIPAIREARGDESSPPRIDIQPVHRFIRG